MIERKALSREEMLPENQTEKFVKNCGGTNYESFEYTNCEYCELECANKNQNLKFEINKSEINLLESIQSCYIHSRNEQVNVVRSFVSNDRFQIHHVTHDRIFTGDSHST